MVPARGAGRRNAADLRGNQLQAAGMEGAAQRQRNGALAMPACFDDPRLLPGAGEGGGQSGCARAGVEDDVGVARCIRRPREGVSQRMSQGSAIVVDDENKTNEIFEKEVKPLLSSSLTFIPKNLSSLLQTIFSDLKNKIIDVDKRNKLYQASQKIEILENYKSHIKDLINLYSRDTIWIAESLQAEISLANIKFENRVKKSYLAGKSYSDGETVEVNRNDNTKSNSLQHIFKVPVNEKENEFASLSANVQLSRDSRLLDNKKVFIKIQLINDSSPFKKDPEGKRYYSVATENVNNRSFFGIKIEVNDKNIIPYTDYIYKRGKKGDFDETVMKGIVLDYEKTKKALLESNEGRVAVMKDAFLANKTVEDVFNSDKRIKSLTKADIVKLANKYFSKNYAVVYRKDKETVFPKVEKPDIEKVKLNNNQKSEFIKSLEGMKPTPIQPKWVDYNKDFKVSSYAPGTVLYHAYNNINDFFNLSISYDYGSHHEKNLCGVMDELNFAGVDKMTAEQVKKADRQLTVEEFKRIIEEQDKDRAILDMRNDYERQLGHFK